jgi:hypothetical protein
MLERLWKRLKAWVTGPAGGNAGIVLVKRILARTRVMMQTHYARRRKKLGVSTRLNSALESVVVQAVPPDRLVTIDQLRPAVTARCHAEGEPPPGHAALPKLLEDLARRGFLAELHGTRVQRFVDSVN